ncbi:hypothetical protein GCT13_13130 [Paraburkholderia sp. CNPSo 3157]|uniref:Uncharacterized protein n=1 Tax=Paraburkholderia franconis TaxID=2654983 RepID=A0A7X1N9I0_9BURK|nr:hypothetical protein [Paraburkholderia franconis]MPW17855.1 hypothetical protein [Paraburkholderia franconis]
MSSVGGGQPESDTAVQTHGATTAPRKHLLDYVTVLVAVFAAAVSAFSALATWYQYRASRDQLAAMKSDQRAWISLDLEESGPLDHGSQGWTYVFNYKLTNVGRSPASGLTLTAEMIPLAPPFTKDPGTQGFSYPEPIARIHDATEEMCEASLRDARTGFADGLFPNGEKRGKWRVRDNSPGDAYLAGFAVVACVTYKNAGDPEVHRTARVFTLENHDVAKPIHIGDDGIVFQGFDFAPYPLDGWIAD